MLPEVNTSNPNFQVFQSSVVGSMQEAEARRKKKEPTRLKKIKETQNKDEYSSTAKDSIEKDEEGFVEPLSKEEKKKRQKQAGTHANNQYAKSAYNNQQNLEESIEEKHIKPIVEI